MKRTVVWGLIGVFLLFAFVTCETPTSNSTKTNYFIRIFPVPANGTVEPDTTKAKSGATVKLTIAPDNDYVLLEESLRYNDGEDHIITENSFTMPAHDVTVTCSFINPAQEELESIYKFLYSIENYHNGNFVNDPILIEIKNIIPLESLYDTLESADKYVVLDLSGSGITTWNYIRGHKLGKGKIVSLILPDTVIDLPDNNYVAYEEGFASFDNLTLISGANIQTIGSAFQDCRSLTNVDLPTVTTIGRDAFSYCDSLKEINFPLAVSVCHSSFFRCYSLTEVNLPKSISIDENAFFVAV
jgi:hypothetical protein